MNLAEVQCANCGVLCAAEAETCAACGHALSPAATDAAVASSDTAVASSDTAVASSDTAVAATTPNPSGATVRATDSDPAMEDTVDGTMIGRPDHALIGGMVGEYQVQRIVGEGGMGTVYAGVHPLIGKQVAIKILKPALSDDEDVMERFLAEAKAVNTIRHQNIIDIFSFGRIEDESQYFVMEYLEGQSLGAYLREKKTVSYAVGLSILSQVLDALKAAHEHGIVHRDLKPDNIYLANQRDGSFFVKLLDFGVAKFIEDGVSVGHTRTGVPIGTPLYMSPEQCRGRDVSVHSDIYSLGVIMYEMFTGRTPFAAKTVYQLVNAHVSMPPVAPSTLVDFPDELESLILKCLEKDPARRPPSAEALDNELRPILERLAAAATPVPTPMPALPEPEDDHQTTGPVGSTDRRTTSPVTRARSRVVPLLAAVVAAVVIGVIAFFALRGRGAPDDTKQASAPPPMAAPDTGTMAPPMRPTSENKVWIQFAINPAHAHAKIRVDGKLIPDTEIEVPKSHTRKLRVKITAKGYQDYFANPLPVSHLVLTVNLIPATSGTPMEPASRPRRHRWHAVRRPRRPPPEMRPAARRPREVRVRSFGTLD